MKLRKISVVTGIEPDLLDQRRSRSDNQAPLYMGESKKSEHKIKADAKLLAV